MADLVTYALDGAVATLTLNRPDRLNALTPSLFNQWQEQLDKALADGARAIVITGSGKGFCAGADLTGGDGPEDALDPDLAVTLEGYYNPMARRLAEYPVPVVMAVNGAAVGAGMGFALAGDLVVMGQSASMMLAFANIGLVPDAGTTWSVARAVGRAKTLELALLGEKIDAGEALAMGLVNRVVGDEDLLSEAQALAARLAAGPTKALSLIRKQVGFALDNDFDAVLRQEAINQSAAGFSADFAEAVMAFREKRKPVFKGA